MTITKRVAIGPVTFGGGGDRLDVSVQEQFLEDGQVVGTGVRHLLQLRESAAITLADGDAWNNSHVEQLIRAVKVVDQPEVLGMPEIPAIVRNGEEIRAAVPAVAARPETQRLQFDPSIPLVWIE